MLTSAGFKRLRTADYLPIIQEQARELFGEDADLSERTPLGKFIYLQAQQRAEDNELSEQVWNSRFVDTSEGSSLEANVKRALITRKKWLKASGRVVFNLNRGTTVPIGTLVRTPYNVYFKTLENINAADDGNYSVDVEAVEHGAIGNAQAGEINIIVNPQLGIHSVTNPDAFLNGQDEETEEELKERYYASLSKLGNRRTESIRATILDEVKGVRSCLVIENDTLLDDEDGRPGKSFETIVLGGERQNIAQKIFESKPWGIRAYGQEVVNVTDSQGFDHPIGFSYAAPIQIYAKAQIKKSSTYPINGDEQIIEQIVKFIGGVNNNTQYNGLGMSEDVVQARLESRLFAVEGVTDAKVLLSLDGETYEEVNIPIGFAQVAETDSSKIEVSELV
jgi:uncharacterized phage protein gp47/JayE